MAEYTYRGIALYDPISNQLLTDTAVRFMDRVGGAEQAVTSLDGVAIQLTSNRWGIIPDFRAPIPIGELVSGNFATPIVCEEIPRDAAAAIADLAATRQAAADAQTAATQAQGAAQAAQSTATGAQQGVDALLKRKFTAGTGLSGGGDHTDDRAFAIASGVTPTTAPVYTSGSLDDLGIGYNIIRHTSTPSGTWGAYEGVPASNSVLIQRFWGDTADRTARYERIRTGTSAPYSFSAWSRLAGTITPPGNISGNTGWTLDTLTKARNGNAVSVSFEIRPNSNAPWTEQHKIATSDAALTNLLPARIPVMSFLTGVNTTSVSVLWDKGNGIFFLHTNQDIPAGSRLAVAATFITP